MDFSNLSNDELADVVKDVFDELHARHDALSPSGFKTRSGRLLRVAHGAFESIKDHCVDEEMIQPFSGGDPKPPEGP